MRLSTEQAQAIVESVREIDPEAEIFLFGSRADDQARGGDIDLLVMSEKIDLDQKLQLKLRLVDRLGPQKIDLVVARDTDQPFVRIARAEGIRL
jgi:predicted nucleotidyltransferase